MTEINLRDAHFHPEGDIAGTFAEQSRMELLVEKFNGWWQKRKAWQQSSILAAGIALAALVAAGVGWVAIRHTSAPVNVAASFNEDAASKSQEGFNVFRKAYEQLNQQQIESRGAINTLIEQTKANTNDIKSIKAAQQGNPKILEDYQIDIDAIKKLMAVPPVKLIPMSALESADKTS